MTSSLENQICPERLKQVSLTLENTFDFSFELMSETEAQGYLLDYGVENTEFYRNHPLMVRLFAEQRLLLIPFHDQDMTLFYAVALVQTHEPELYARLGACAMEMDALRSTNHELIEENESFAQQVSDDFEELHFLREIARHLEINRDNVEFRFLAEQISRLLSMSIRADLISVVLRDNDSDQLDVVACFGRNNPSIDMAQNLIQQELSRNELQEVAIINDAAKFNSRFNKYAIAPIRSEDDVLGWLFAAEDARDSPSPRTTDYGSNEGSLLESAARMLASHLLNLKLLGEKQKLLTNVVRSLVSAIDAKDGYTCGHSERVALYARQLGDLIGYSDQDLEQLYLCGLLHDVGKIGISDSVLNKPAPLSDEEHQQVMRHPDEGWNILHELPHLSGILPGVVHHHERVDGEGYPDGLKGEEIPMDGRILAVVDAFDAMTSDRAYRAGMPVSEAVEILESGAGEQWDAKLVVAFIQNVDKFVQIKDSYRPKSQKVRKRKN